MNPLQAPTGQQSPYTANVRLNQSEGDPSESRMKASMITLLRLMPLAAKYDQTEKLFMDALDNYIDLRCLNILQRTFKNIGNKP